jgi:isoleucyl-tRNA synthetase
LRELLIFHPDEQYLDDVRPLQRYLQSELNVRDVVFSSDETRSGVKYKANADWPVLGRKLRKDINRVKNGLPLLSSDDVKGYIKNGLITVDGIQLVQGDLTVSRYVELPSGDQTTFAPNTDNDVVIVLDIQVHPELVGEGLARELINRVQKLRKKAGLQATDDVDVFYQFDAGADADELKRAMQDYGEMIKRAIRGSPIDVTQRVAGKEQIIEEVQEVADVRFTLVLVKK